jgi:hypothetical protein
MNEMNDITYSVTTETVGGVRSFDATVYTTLEDALNGARTVIGSPGTKDGWIEDSNGNRVADFKDMKDHAAKR